MIDELAERAGIAGAYTDYFGASKTVSRETKIAILNAMGYDARTDRAAAAIVRDLPPKRAYVPTAFDRRPSFGFALQLYSLRSARNWGIGDFSDLAAFAQLAAREGASCVALNPLHQLHLIDPMHASPYSPLSRLYLNALYIDVEAAARTLGVPLGSVDRGGAVASDLVDYARVAALKIPALRAVYDSFRQRERLHDAFDAFRAAAGPSLHRTAAYQALCAHFGAGWMHWPPAFRDPGAPAVAQFAREHEREIGFYEFLQWIADDQLARAAQAAAPMSVGLYRDLAVGVDTESADVWSDRNVYALGISAGAPPDALNTEGQSWGLPPLNPRVLQERSYAPLREMVRANMRHAGALRIDHVMGLMRLFVVPDGAPPREGAYVSYPFEEMADVVSEESVRNACMIVGEDLGTLPSGFRDEMALRRFFSCRLLYFEDPSQYPHDAVASTGTHDLPPLIGFEHELAERTGALPLACAAYEALGCSRAALVLLQMEDALLQTDPVNVPGTTTEAPNWRRKLPVAVEMLQEDSRFATIVTALREARSRARSE